MASHKRVVLLVLVSNQNESPVGLLELEVDGLEGSVNELIHLDERLLEYQLRLPDQYLHLAALRLEVPEVRVDLADHDSLLLLKAGDQRVDLDGVGLRGVELLAEFNAQCRRPQLDVPRELDILLLNFSVASQLVVDKFLGRRAYVFVPLNHLRHLNRELGA